MTAARRPDRMAEEGGNEHLILRLLDNIEKDVAKLDREQTDTERVARSAFNRVEAVEDTLAAVRERIDENVERLRQEIERVSAESRQSTMSLVEIKAVAKTAGKTAGYVGGALAGSLLGLLGTILGAFLLKLLNLG